MSNRSPGIVSRRCDGTLVVGSRARPTFGLTARSRIEGSLMAVPSSLPTTSRPVGESGGLPVVAGPIEVAASNDPLAALGPIVAAVAESDRRSSELTADRREAAEKFLEDFATACEAEVKPAMAAVLERLCQLGGGGLIEEHPGGEARFRNPRLALWMSLKGEIVGEPHLDRYPYLQLEADVEALKVQVDEGDMWRGAGGNSTGRAGTWDMVDLTRRRVTEELLAVAQRAVQ